MPRLGAHLPSVARREQPVAVWGPSGQVLAYERYLKLQERLRSARRELLLFCEHPPTITAGVQSRAENLLLSAADLAEQGVALASIGRGGDHTAHEPGQLVIYPHIDIERRGIPVSRFFQGLLDVTAGSLEEVWALPTTSQPDAPGLYLADGSKLASVGIMFKRFFTSFGVSVNISNDLHTFAMIHPCGDPGLQVTSVAATGGDPGVRHLFRQEWTSRFQSFLAVHSG